MIVTCHCQCQTQKSHGIIDTESRDTDIDSITSVSHSLTGCELMNRWWLKIKMESEIQHTRYSSSFNFEVWLTWVLSWLRLRVSKLVYTHWVSLTLTVTVTHAVSHCHSLTRSLAHSLSLSVTVSVGHSLSHSHWVPVPAIQYIITYNYKLTRYYLAQKKNALVDLTFQSHL